MRIQQKYIFALILIIGFIVSYLAYNLTTNFENERILILFEKDANDRIELIHSSFINSGIILESTKNLFVASEQISRNEFRSFTQYYFENVKGLKALEWIPKVSHKEKNSFINKAIRDGYKNFNFKELDKNKKFVNVKKREFYYPVFYVEPLLGNEEAFGFDLGSNPERYTSLKKAETTEKMVASEKLKLVQENNGSFSILVFTPLFNSLKNNESEYNRKLTGFVLGILQIEGLVEESLSHIQSMGINISLIDESAPDDKQLLYSHSTRVKSKSNEQSNSFADYVYSKSFEFGGRRYSINCYPTISYFKNHSVVIPEIVLVISISLTFAFFIYYKRNINQKQKINSLVEEKTKELFLVQERLSMAIQGANIGIWDWNVKTGDVHFNEKWAKMLEYELDEIEPNINSWSKLIHPDDNDIVLDVLNKHFEGITPIYKTEQRLLTKSGNWKWILDIGKVFERDENNKPIRATGIHLDISELKKYQQELVDQNKELETHVKNKNRLFSIIGHDLRSPLASILGFSEFLKSDIDDLSKEEIVEYAGYIFAASNNINNLLLNLLEWGRFQMGKLQFLAEEYNLSYQMDEILDRYLLMALNKKIKFKKNYSDDLIITADRNMIDTTIRNIISNAIKFSSRDSYIQFYAEKTVEFITVKITDSGIGIDQKTIDSLFTESFIHSSPGTEGEGGTGLGLSMCKEFIEQHKGKICIESEVNKGTTISFSLPRTNYTKSN